MLSIIYLFIPVTGCVGMDPSPRCHRGPIMLLRRPWNRMPPSKANFSIGIVCPIWFKDYLESHLGIYFPT